MKSSLVILLVQACSKSIIRCVCFHIYWFSWVEYYKNGCGDKFLFQKIKDVLGQLIPLEWDSFLSEAVQWGSEFGIVDDEASIIVS